MTSRIAQPKFSKGRNRNTSPKESMQVVASKGGYIKMDLPQDSNAILGWPCDRKPNNTVAHLVGSIVRQSPVALREALSELRQGQLKKAPQLYLMLIGALIAQPSRWHHSPTLFPATANERQNQR